MSIPQFLSSFHFCEWNACNVLYIYTYVCLTMFRPSRLLGFLSGSMSAHFFLHPWKGVGGTRALAHLLQTNQDNQVSTRSTFFGSVYLYWVFLASSCINMFTKHVHQLYSHYFRPTRTKHLCDPAVVRTLLALILFGLGCLRLQLSNLGQNPEKFRTVDTKLGLLSSTKFYLP